MIIAGFVVGVAAELIVGDNIRCWYLRYVGRCDVDDDGCRRARTTTYGLGLRSTM